MGLLPVEFVSGDFNKDGILDIAVAARHDVIFGDGVSILAGNGRGEFAEVHNIPFAGHIYRLATGDFNGDGAPDLAATVAGNNAGVAIALSQGDWTFTTPIIQKAWIRQNAGVVVSDFNADGKLDIIFSGDQKLNVMKGKGDGSFSEPIGYGAGNLMPAELIAADFSGDGKPDLFVRGEDFDRKPELYINDGSGGFTPGGPIDVVPGGAVAAGDLNNDGKMDLAFVGFTGPQERGVAVSFNNGSGGFGAPIQFPLGYGFPSHILIADINGDGKSDLIVTVGQSNYLTTFLGNGAGGFSRISSYSVGPSPIAALAGDFNRDGKFDLAMIQAPNQMSILPGVGDGRFQAPRATDLSTYAIRFATLADVNKDGKLDAVCALSGAQGVLVASGNGDGAFASPKIYPAGSDNNDVAVADFNKDGWLDIVTVGGAAVFPPYTSSMALLLGSPTGEFTISPKNPNNQIAGQTLITVVSADFNRDGNPDLAVGSYSPGGVSFLMGNGQGDFAPAINIPIATIPSGFAPGDFNNDGNPDLAVTNYSGATVSILKGDGRGGFSVSTFAVTGPTVAVAAADFNNDGKLDLAVTHRENPAMKNLSILIGNGDGSFRAPVVLTTDQTVVWLATGDFTGDGKFDIAVTQKVNGVNATYPALIFAGDGAGDFARAAEVYIPDPDLPFSGDLNGDGLTDLLVTTKTGIFTTLASCSPPPVSTITSVSAASYFGVAQASDSIASIFGAQLSTGTSVAPSVPLPTELAGARVLVKDAKGVERLSSLFFVSPYQINYLVPTGTAPGMAIVTVKNGNNTTTGSLLTTPAKPGIFTANSDGVGAPAAYLLRVRSGGAQSIEPVIEFDSVLNRYVPRPIDFFSDSTTTPDTLYLVMFGTGIRNHGSLADVTAATRGIGVDVLYAGPQNNFVGLDQVNLRLTPLGGGPQLVYVQIAVNGVSSNGVYLNYK